jgi:hypothetical protein
VRLVGEAEASETGHREFARRNRVKTGTLRSWIYRLRRETRTEVAAAGGPALVPVRVVASTAPSARWERGGGGEALVEADLPSGVRVRFVVGTDTSYLADLLRQLG